MNIADISSTVLLTGCSVQHWLLTDRMAAGAKQAPTADQARISPHMTTNVW
eukprot:CAMPEP_0206152024 /NCGR_PEP_ID=MMETSP1473-20131121/39118_1 /ASSEMBLY_ACC=CAM_ASM_001109 /TAXON_ID=1461547 /ORGANISM="Stichococcus sp, Strain RCC1054" /LENGTH=50 /DNA_ID=CAMNT_0053549577 /DNA_START=247 /DNA_END=396 /DNA_ORIENTATION=+